MLRTVRRTSKVMTQWVFLKATLAKFSQSSSYFVDICKLVLQRQFCNIVVASSILSGGWEGVREQLFAIWLQLDREEVISTREYKIRN